MASRRDDNVLRAPAWHKRKIGERVDDVLVGHAEELFKNAKSEHRRNYSRMRIYEAEMLSRNREAVAALDSIGMKIARLNALKSIIDTFVSRLSKDRPMPGIATDGASYQLKQQARQFRQFIVGKMRSTKFDGLSRDALLDAAIVGDGYTLIDDADGGIFAERVLPNDLVFDKRECRYGTPRQAFRVRRVARDVLEELYPDKADVAAIRRSPPSEKRPDDDFEDDMLGDLDDYVDVFEAWCLPVRDDGSDGRRAVVVKGGTLVLEEWLEPRFPWGHVRVHKPLVGLKGKSFTDQLAPMQHRVNSMVRDLQLNIAAAGRGMFLVNEKNDIPANMLVGFEPFKLKFNGPTPPQWHAPQMFNPAQITAVEKFIDWMHDLSGVSRAATTSKSSLGPGASGIALDTQYDIDSDRFRLPQANYADYRMDCAQRYIDAGRRRARRNEADKGKKRSHVAMSWKNRDEYEMIDWGDVAFAEGKYELQIQAQNYLPDEKAGKLSVVEQLAKAGVIPQWMVPMLFDEPDLVQANNVVLAPVRNAFKKMDVLLDVNKPIPTIAAHNDLDLLLKISTAYCENMEEQEAPDEIQDRFAQFRDLVVQMIAQKSKDSPAAAAPAMAPAEQPLPGGVPPMPQGPVPAPEMIGAPPMPPPAAPPGVM